MSQGGAQGLQFGPFPQNIARFKRLSTRRGVAVSTPDPELLWNRGNRLVEGFYEVHGRLFCTELSGAANEIAWLWNIPDSLNAIVSITVENLDLTAAATLPPVDWSGDGDARYSTILPTANGTVSALLHGMIFVPEPGNVSLDWAAVIGDAQVNAHTLVRLELIR